jgi:hypothetical protein
MPDVHFIEGAYFSSIVGAIRTPRASAAFQISNRKHQGAAMPSLQLVRGLRRPGCSSSPSAMQLPKHAMGIRIRYSVGSMSASVPISVSHSSDGPGMLATSRSYSKYKALQDRKFSQESQGWYNFHLCWLQRRDCSLEVAAFECLPESRVRCSRYVRAGLQCLDLNSNTWRQNETCHIAAQFIKCTIGKRRNSASFSKAATDFGEIAAEISSKSIVAITPEDLTHHVGFYDLEWWPEDPIHHHLRRNPAEMERLCP